MSFLANLLGKEKDPLLERAGSLVEAAEINAVGMFTPLLDRFSILRKVDVARWDFILTVAGVFMAASRLNNLRLGEAREEKLMGVVTECLDQWKSDGTRGFDDCNNFFKRTFDGLTAAGHEARFVASDAVGMWIVWNIFGHPSNTEEERMLVRTVGGMVTHAFFDWWD